MVFSAEPVSLRAHPVGSVLDVPVMASVLKSCVYAVPDVVRLMQVDAEVPCVSDMAMMAKAKETNTLSPMNDPSRRFLADRPNARKPIWIFLSFAKREAGCSNSEREGERVLFICSKPTPAADWKWICPRRLNQMGTPFNPLHVPNNWRWNNPF